MFNYQLSILAIKSFENDHWSLIILKRGGYPMEEQKFVKGGAFLVESISPQEVFTPEDFTEEQRLIGKAATEFIVGEVQPVVDDIEAQKEGLLPSLVKKAGELGLLSGDIEEEYEGQGLDKVSVLLMMEKLSQGGGSFMVAYAVHTGIGSLPIIFFGNKDRSEERRVGKESRS